MKQATDQKEEKNSEMMCESSGLFVILHQQWRGVSGTGRDGAGRGGTNPSFTGETPGNEHIVHINI